MYQLLKRIFNKRKEIIASEFKEPKGLTREMIDSLKDGIRLSEQRNYESALKKFDIAIETGLFKEAYRERGYCLQILGFHLDSINDFSKAIKLFPENANNYYGRALSKGSLGYYEDAINDANKAVELSQIRSKENLDLIQFASEKNIMPPTILYRDYLNELEQRKSETNEDIRNIYISKPIRRSENSQ